MTIKPRNTKSRLHHSEAELVRFTRARGVASAAMERDIALQKLGEADAAYRQIDQDRVETERRIASLREQLKSFPSRSVTLKRWADNPEALEKMKTHLLELLLKRTDLLSRFEPSYRLVQEVEQEIAETRASIAAEALTPVRDETTDKDPNYEWARMELEKAQVQWEGLRARQSDALRPGRIPAHVCPADAIRLGGSTGSDAHRQGRGRQLSALPSQTRGSAHWRRARRAPHPQCGHRGTARSSRLCPRTPCSPISCSLLYWPRRFSVGIAFTAEYFDPTIRTPDEAHGLLEVPVLAWLPAPEPADVRPFISRIGRPKVVVP